MRDIIEQAILTTMPAMAPGLRPPPLLGLELEVGLLSCVGDDPVGLEPALAVGEDVSWGISAVLVGFGRDTTVEY